MNVPAFLLVLLAAPQPVEASFLVDYSSGTKRVNRMAVSVTAAALNPQGRNNLVFPRPGTSRLRATFVVPKKPSKAFLQLEHLSSGAPVLHGGNSRITIKVNGHAVVKEWEIGSHGFTVDRLTLTKLLRAGANTLELQFVAGQTTYWLKRLEVQCTFPAGTVLGGKARWIGEAKGAKYAVVVSAAAFKDARWRRVVEALRAKHRAAVLVYPGAVSGARAELARLFPRYACFVARPEEAGRGFVIAVHRMTRALDADPYTDVRWGILTGYVAEDALRIARRKKPLLIRRAAAGCGLDLGAFQEGVRYSEGEKNAMWVKRPGGKALKQRCPDDTTKPIVEMLNGYRPQLFVTSGHATHRDWQIGYSYKNGQLRCKDGQLFGLDLQGRRHPIRSPNPKVYSGAGNCLIGLIEDKQTMALAWIHSGGAHQLLGYVVSTWYGYGAWGANEIFIRQQGRFSFAEAFFLNNQALVARLQREYPTKAGVEFEEWGIERDPRLPAKLARKHGLPDRDSIGLLWDRDTVALYGDPAWSARVERVREPAWKQTLTESGGRWTFEVTTTRAGSWHRPPAAFLPRRLRDIRIVAGAELKPVVTDDFVLVPRKGKFQKGETLRVVFEATPIEAARAKPKRYF